MEIENQKQQIDDINKPNKDVKFTLNQSLNSVSSASTTCSNLDLVVTLKNKDNLSCIDLSQNQSSQHLSSSFDPDNNNNRNNNDNFVKSDNYSLDDLDEDKTDAKEEDLLGIKIEQLEESDQLKQQLNSSSTPSPKQKDNYSSMPSTSSVTTSDNNNNISSDLITMATITKTPSSIIMTVPNTGASLVENLKDLSGLSTSCSFDNKNDTSTSSAISFQGNILSSTALMSSSSSSSSSSASSASSSTNTSPQNNNNNNSNNTNSSSPSTPTISKKIKSNQIVQTLSASANATSEALANLISSTDSSNKNSQSVTPNASEINNNNYSTKQSKQLINQNSQPLLSQSLNEFASINANISLPVQSKKERGSSASNTNNNLNKTSIGVVPNNMKEKEKSKKPWYSAFINTYKQKNEDFKRLFKLPAEEHLLVDYSCALQREILAHGRLYISLNYVCFRANIIGWETTLIIKLKDIRSIFKDKTAKIIPNAISVLLDTEKYFFTSFVSRDKTYTTLFRVWQIALADASMGSDEINNILKSCYGDDLGYNSDDAEYEYYSKLKTKPSSSSGLALAPSLSNVELENKFQTNNNYNNKNQPFPTSTNSIEIVTHKSNKAHKSKKLDKNIVEAALDTNKTNTNLYLAGLNELGSFSDDQSGSTQANLRKSSNQYNKMISNNNNTNNNVNSSASSADSSTSSSFSATNPNENDNFNSKNGSESSFFQYHHQMGHRQSSSFDTSMIDTSENFNGEVLVPVPNTTGVWLKRPRSMVVSKQQSLSVPSTQLNQRHVSKNQSQAIQINTTTGNMNSNGLSLSPGSQMTSAQHYQSPPPVLSLSPPSHSTVLGAPISDTDESNPLRENDYIIGTPIQSPIVNTSMNKHIENSEVISQLPSVNSVTNNTDVDIDIEETSTATPSKIPSSHASQAHYQESSSSGGEQEPIEESNIPMIDNAKCSCGEHQGKEMLNQVFNLNVNYLWECIFGHTTFCKKYWESRKFGNIKIGDWKMVNSLPFRQLEYTVDLGGTIGRPKNVEEQRILEYKPDQCIVLESESATHGVPYADYFTVRNRFCLTRCTSNTTRLSVTSFLNYNQKPNFIAKSFIERNCMGALKDSYNYLEKNLPNVQAPSKKAVHISAIPSDYKNKKETNANSSSANLRAISSQQSLPATLHPNIRNSTAASLDSAIAESARGHQHHHNHHHVNNSSNINNVNPNVASSSSTTTKKKRHSNIANNNLTHSPNVMNSNIEHSSKHQYEAIDSSYGNSNNQYQILDSGSQQVQTQLVPIQKFSFFKWDINVDTLVRLFIVAMICLMIINGMLYYKLRRIESLADSLKTDPSLISRMSNPSKQFEQLLNDNSYSKELYNWRDLITNTLTAIEKMENSLKQWDKNLQLRQKNSAIHPQQNTANQETPQTSASNSQTAAGSSNEL